MDGHVWQVGDLCTYVSTENAGWGVLYRVEKIHIDDRGFFKPGLFDLLPITAVFFSVKKRRRMKGVDPSRCTYMSLVDLATEYAKFGLFIAEEAKKRGADDATTTDA